MNSDQKCFHEEVTLGLVVRISRAGVGGEVALLACWAIGTMGAARTRCGRRRPVGGASE